MEVIFHLCKLKVFLHHKEISTVCANNQNTEYPVLTALKCDGLPLII